MKKTWRTIAPSVALVILALIVIYFFGVRPIQQLNEMKGSLQPKDYLELRGNALNGLAQALGGAILLVGLFFTWRNLRTAEANTRAAQENTAKSLAIAQEGQITERYTHAVEQLGNQVSLATRLGGIYALEQIARVSEEYYKPIVELFTAFVREHSRCEDPESAETQRAGLDIQTILTVLGRRTRFSEHDPNNPLNLIATNLKLVTLPDCHFERAVFARSNLQGAFLSESHFESATFRKCNLRKAVMEKAHLKDAIFIDASMEGTNLLEVNGEKAAFVMARLERGILYQSKS